MKTKECTTCQEVKPLDEFGKKKQNKDGLYNQCKLCRAKTRKDRVSLSDTVNPLKTRFYKNLQAELIADEKKICSRCMETKPFSDYHKSSTAGGGVSNYCIKCTNKGTNRSDLVYRNNEGKNCSRCGEFKEYSEFYKQKGAYDGYRYDCKSCNRESQKKDRYKYKGNRAEYSKLYRLKNKEKIKEGKIAYEKNNRKKINKMKNEYQKLKCKTDPVYNTMRRLRYRTWFAFKNKGYKKTSKTQEILGADWETVTNHLESQLTEGMSWDNQGDWHIDHIIPLASADTIEGTEYLCHYQNLQPLWAKDNLRKNKYMPPLCVQYRVHKAITESKNI